MKVEESIKIAPHKMCEGLIYICGSSEIKLAVLKSSMSCQCAHGATLLIKTQVQYDCYLLEV